MRQRVMIAMAMMCEPALLVADEPTTALDATVQAQVLDLIEDLRKDTNAAVALITHDMGVIARMAQRVAVMRRGEIVETRPGRGHLSTSRRPTTRACCWRPCRASTARAHMTAAARGGWPADPQGRRRARAFSR